MSKKRKRRKILHAEEKPPENIEAAEDIPQEESESDQSQGDPPAGCLLRLFWMLAGNAILLLSIFSISQHRSSIFGVWDIVYWAIVLAVLTARYLDIQYFNGTTVDDEPATMSHWRRYAGALLALCLLFWLVAHAIAYVFA